MTKTEGEIRHPRPRVRWVLATVGALSVLIAWLMLIVRDRYAGTAVFLYIPAGAIGAVAAISLIWLWWRSQGVGRRAGLGGCVLLGVSAAAWDVAGMCGAGVVPKRSEVGLRVLHWNVMWGGDWRQVETGWPRLIRSIEEQRPDLVFLSEAPEARFIELLAERLGSDWSWAKIEHEPGTMPWQRLVVLARGTVGVPNRIELTGGVGMDVRVHVSGSPWALRLLLVDGESDPGRWKRPFLESVANVLEHEAEIGTPFDLVAGDFNVPGRSLGYVDVERAGPGYTRTAEKCQGWMGTWPMMLPWLDLDHVYVSKTLALHAHDWFWHPSSDHRGQVATVLVGSDSVR